MKPSPEHSRKTVRCAIYTRKSSEEGLQQDFNSLDAQREACAAYILSQASEGWVALPDVYDDGGLSGGTLERPALQRLLGEVAAGRVDTVVVYKVDRLTRSLSDFSKLVDVFDAAGTSFVSVTQSFNTTTSMGRLTLNMLLSFAQFEREVTAERIRDKIAASKAKGMWMGGVPPIGYEPDGRTLAVVEPHAEIVRTIFERYLELGNVRLLAAALAREGIVAPRRSLTNGKMTGGAPLGRGQLYLVLRNPIYVGEIAHRDTTYPGLHDAIVDREVWDAAQALMAEHRQGYRTGIRTANPSPLAGRVFDAAGEPLVATHAAKRASEGEDARVRYRYYVSRALQHDAATSGLRIPAPELERAVANCLADALDDPTALAGLLGTDLGQVMLAGDYSAKLSARLRKAERGVIRELVTRVQVLDDRLDIECDAARLVELLDLSCDTATFTLSTPARLQRKGHVTRVIDTRGVPLVPQANEPIVRLMAKGHGWWRRLRQGDIDVTTLAREQGVATSYVTWLVRLAFLSPRMTTALLEGRQRDGVGSEVLTLPDAVPAAWNEQEARYL